MNLRLKDALIEAFSKAARDWLEKPTSCEDAWDVYHSIACQFEALRDKLRDHGTLFGVEIPEQVPDAEPLRDWLARWPNLEKYTDPDTISGHALIAIRSALGEKGGE